MIHLRLSCSDLLEAKSFASNSEVWLPVPIVVERDRDSTRPGGNSQRSYILVAIAVGVSESKCPSGKCRLRKIASHSRCSFGAMFDQSDGDPPYQDDSG